MKIYQLVPNNDGSSFYEWNMDDTSENQIINLLHKIAVVANAYKIKTNNFDHHVAYKSYDYCLSLLYKIHIFCSNIEVKLDKILGSF